MTESAAHVRVIEETPAYWRVVFDNPHLNMVDATMFEGLQGSTQLTNLIMNEMGAYCIGMRTNNIMAQVEPYGIDKLAVDDFIHQTYEDRPSTLRNFSEIFLQIQKNLVLDKICNLSLGLAASAYATIQCAIELLDADLRKNLDNIQVPTLILHWVNDHACLFDLAKVCMITSKGHNLYRLKKARHGV